MCYPHAMLNAYWHLIIYTLMTIFVLSSNSFLFKKNVLNLYLYVWIYVKCILCEYTQRPEEAIGSLEARVTGGCEPWHRCWKPNFIKSASKVAGILNYWAISSVPDTYKAVGNQCQGSQYNILYQVVFGMRSHSLHLKFFSNIFIRQSMQFR